MKSFLILIVSTIFLAALAQAEQSNDTQLVVDISNHNVTEQNEKNFNGIFFLRF